MSSAVNIEFGDSTCKVHLFGATLISWQCNGEEHIFVSSKSHYDGKKAIRGGIPIVFPCFGPWSEGPQHGFARIQQWSVQQQPKKVDDGCQAVFCLEDNEFTRNMWNHKFKLLYTVTLREKSLHTQLNIVNTGDSVFDFTCLLHTYLRVRDISKVTVTGFKDLAYMDKVKGGQMLKEDREPVTISEEVDRVYSSTGDSHTVSETGQSCKVLVTKHNLPDTVLWNPWQEKSVSMSDMDDDAWKHMVCVEAGRVVTWYKLQPGDSFQGAQTLSLQTDASL